MGTRQAVLGAAAAAGLLFVGGCGFLDQKRETDKESIGQEIRSLQFDADSAEITISVGDTTSVQRTIHYGDEKPGDTVRVEGDALTLESCPVRDCTIDYEVVVPAGTAVSGQIDSGNVDVSGVAGLNLQASSGDVRVSDVSGAVNVTADSGTIEVTNADGPVTLAASSGDVTARGIRGATQVELDSGTVTVELVEADSVRVNADSGDIDVTVPRAAYQLTTATDSGDVTSDITSDPAASHVLDLHADSGNITVRQA